MMMIMTTTVTMSEVDALKVRLRQLEVALAVRVITGAKRGPRSPSM